MLSNLQVKECADKALTELGAPFSGWRCDWARYKAPSRWRRPRNPSEGSQMPPLLEFRFTNSHGKRRGMKWPIRDENPDVITEGLKEILVHIRSTRG